MEYELKFRASAQIIRAVSEKHLGVQGLLGTTREDLNDLVRLLFAKQSIVSGNQVAVVSLDGDEAVIRVAGKGDVSGDAAHFQALLTLP